MHKHGGPRRLRNYLLTGLVVTGPISITIYLTWSLIQWVDGLVKPLFPPAYNPDTYLPFPMPGFGLIVAVLTLMLIGFLTANIVGRTFINFGEQLFDRMPLVRNLYRALKQIFQTVLHERGASFTRAGLIEYPRQGLWAIVFVSSDARGEIAHRLAGDDDGGDDHKIAVFLPTTPNPTSGFLLYVPRRDIQLLDMSVEDAAKLVISAGLVTPRYQPSESIPASQVGIATASLEAYPNVPAAVKSRVKSDRRRKDASESTVAE